MREAILIKLYRLRKVAGREGEQIIEGLSLEILRQTLRLSPLRPESKKIRVGSTANAITVPLDLQETVLV